MGGEESMIDENTKGIFIEAARFDYAAIRRTSIRLNLITEAAQRFSKGIERLAMKKAVDRSVQLLTELADASGFEETVVAGDPGYEPIRVTETLTHCNELLGTSFSMDQVEDVLTRLDFKPEIDGDTVVSNIPSYRIDIERPADIDEEIIRLIGFDSLPTTLMYMETTSGKLTPAQNLRRLTRQTMTGLGLHEIVTYSLVGQDYIDKAFMAPGEPVALAMPMSEARKYMRTSLINSVLDCVRYNEAHSNEGNNFFEISKVYSKDHEEERLAIVLDSPLQSDALHKYSIEADFYAMKGILLEYLAKCGYRASRVHVKENKTDTDHFHPYRSAELYVDKTLLGVFGEIHPAFGAEYDLKRVVYAELFMEPLTQMKASKVKFTELDKFPAVSRDIAVVVDTAVTAQQLTDTIRKAGKKIVRSMDIFDVYEGEHVAEGKKSVALHILYQANDHTLKDEEITEAHEAIVAALKKQVNAELRG